MSNCLFDKLLELVRTDIRNIGLHFKIQSDQAHNFQQLVPLTMYYNGLVISHKRNVNFLAENDGVVVGNFRYTWTQVSFVYICVCVFPCVREFVCIYILTYW